MPAARLDSAVPDPLQPSSPTHVRRADASVPRQDAERGAAGEGRALDVDAYIARLVGQAPPLSSWQRDRLALILHGLRHQ
jgi:hypothetical protein